MLIDVGANIGAISLPAAGRMTGRHIYAVPTDYAFDKLIMNLSRNPSLREKVIPIKAFVGSESAVPRT